MSSFFVATPRGDRKLFSLLVGIACSLTGLVFDGLDLVQRRLVDDLSFGYQGAILADRSEADINRSHRVSLAL